jgi:hypothetical protein
VREMRQRRGRVRSIGREGGGNELLSIINRDYTALAILLFERDRETRGETILVSTRDHPPTPSGVRRGERAEDDEETTIV